MARRKKTYKPRSLFATPVPKNVKKPKTKWKILPIVWGALKRGAMALGFLIMFSMLISLYTLSKISTPQALDMPDEMVLVLEFNNAIPETPPEASLVDPFANQQMTLRHYIAAIEEAKIDDRVKGIVARMRGGVFSPAQIEEIRSSMKSFKESGKFAYIYSTSFGDSGGGMGRYYLASIFDELWMQPLGVVSIAGINAEIPFVRETLDDIGIYPNFFQRKEYKTAYESLTNKTISESNREMMEVLINDMKDVMISDIAEDRNMSEEQLVSLVNTGLFVADEALEKGLIDYMDYPDVMLKKIREQVTGNPDDEDLVFQPMKKYVFGIQDEYEKGKLHRGKGNSQAKTGVALVYAVGAIMPGEVQSSAPMTLLNEGIAASNVIAPAIMDAAEDDTIATIILRVDSPGGSPAASEAILRALEVAKEKGKVVLVSMGTTAASGGYWIAANADQIFVSGTTITGSIGVVGGKFVFGDMMDKLGVNWESIKFGRNAEMWSITRAFDESEAERINAMLDNVYRNFLQRVAKGRNMTLEQVDDIAKGRVWSGKSALQVGLADQEGGLLDTINYAATLAGGQDYKDVNLQVFPKPKTAFEQFVALVNGEQVSGNSEPDVRSILLQILQPIIKPAVMAKEPENFMVYDSVVIK